MGEAPRAWGGVKPLRGRSLPGAKLLKKFEQNFLLFRIKSAPPLCALCGYINFIVVFHDARLTRMKKEGQANSLNQNFR